MRRVGLRVRRRAGSTTREVAAEETRGEEERNMEGD